MVGLRTHIAFLGAFCAVASELIKILPVCDKECQEHLIFNKYTQAAQHAPAKTPPQHRALDTNRWHPQKHATSVQKVPLARSVVGARSSTITAVSSISGRPLESGGAKHSSIPQVARGSVATRGVQQHTVSSNSMRQSRSPSSTRILSPPSSAIPQVVHKKPVSAISTSTVQTSPHVQSVTPAGVHKTFGVMAADNSLKKSGSTPSKAVKVVHARPAHESCKKNTTSLEKRLQDVAAVTALQKSTSAPLGELVSLVAKALAEILDKEKRSVKYVKQEKGSALCAPGNASEKGISAGMCLEMPGHKIGVLEQGIRALQWRLQKLEVASANAHPIQYIVPQYYPYAYPPYYGGASYSNPSSVQQTSQAQGISQGKAAEKEQKEPGSAKKSAAPRIEKHSEKDTGTETRSISNSEAGMEIDEDARDDVGDSDTLNKETAHGGESRKTSYEIRGKDAWDKVLSDTRKALFSKLNGEVVDLKGGSRTIGGFSFVENKDAEEAAPASLGVKMHGKTSGLAGSKRWADGRRWAHAAALPQAVSQEGSYGYLPSEEVNPSVPREEKMHGDAYDMSQKKSALLGQVRSEDEVQNATEIDRVVGMAEDIGHIDTSRNAMKTRPLYQNLEELGYKEPAKGEPILELVRRRQDRSSEEGDALHRGLCGSGSDDHGSHSESAEYVYLSDLIRLCSRRP